MIPYKTSKDYARLKQLLDEGNEIVILSTLPSDREKAHLLDESIPRHCFLGSRIRSNRTKISDNDHIYDIGYIVLCSCHLERMPFESWCEAFDIEFIEPNL